MDNKKLIDIYSEVKKDCDDKGIWNREEIKNITEIKIKLTAEGYI